MYYFLPLRWKAGFSVLLILCGRLGLAEAASACVDPITFPPTAQVIDVRNFGAIPDDAVDDTAAIQGAIAYASQINNQSRLWPPFIYLPVGRFLVSRPIEKRMADQTFGSGLILQGAGKNCTTIKLVNSAEGYGDTGHPRAVILTSSHLWQQGGPTAGGKDWQGKGEGNQAFQNSVRDLTIEIGGSNPGAIAIDYLSNNVGAIRHVALYAPSGSGLTGISMRRKWPGPTLLDDIEINGFQTGVDIGETEYSVTIDGLKLRNVREVGLQNNGNALAVRALDSGGPFLAIANTGTKSMIAIMESRIATFQADRPAIINTGLFVYHEMALEGAASTFDADGGKTLRFDGLAAWRPAPTEKVGAISDPGEWVDVATFGAVPDDGTEDGVALQNAFDAAAKSASGTVFLKYGVYLISAPLRLPSGLRRLIGMNSEIRLVGQAPSLLTTVPAEDRSEEGPLLIQDIRAGVREPYLQASTRCIIEHASGRELIVRDLLMFGPGMQSDHFLLCRLQTGGQVYLDDVCCGRLRLAGSQAVWARQLNTEGQQPRIHADETSLWIFGLKTEGSATVLEAENGASSVIFGGLLYPSRPVPLSTPAFRVGLNTPLSVAIAQSAYDPKNSYANMLESDSCLKCVLTNFSSGQRKAWIYQNR